MEKLSGWTVSCAVRNLSDQGARLDLPGGPAVPQAFQLGISGRPPIAAHFVWYKDGQAGVAFSDL